MKFKFYTTLSLLTALLLMTSCGGDPNCISDQIETFKQQESTCSGASVIKYRFEGKVVYAFGQGNCISDGGVTVIDEDCNDVCFLGGIAGFTDCNGVNFSEKAEQLEVLYSVK